MKTPEDPLAHVDLENGILHNALKQIRFSVSESKNHDHPALVSVWCCEIEPSQTKKLVSIIREKVSPHDVDNLVHIKRIHKGPSNSDPMKSVLKVILSTTQFISTKAGVENFLNLILVIDIYRIDIPQTAPETKEVSIRWSLKYWPMSWKGNPNHQFLNSVKFDMPNEKNLIDKLVSQARASGSDEALIAYIVSQERDLGSKIVAVGSNMGSKNPYNHSVMKAIEIISKEEKERRSRFSLTNEPSHYLCHNLVVYTSHEPCVMCCMALVHSRIGRVIYLRESPSSGGLESNYQLGDRDGLNWKFEIWKWIGKEADQISPLYTNV